MDLLYDFLDDKTRLIHLILGNIESEEFTFRVFRPENFLFSQTISSYHAVGRLEDILSGAVVLLKGDHFRLWKVFLKVQNIPHLRPSPAVDGLIIVSDDADVSMPFHY